MKILNYINHLLNHTPDWAEPLLGILLLFIALALTPIIVPVVIGSAVFDLVKELCEPEQVFRMKAVPPQAIQPPKK